MAGNKIRQRQHRKLIKNRAGLVLVAITSLGVAILLSALKPPHISIAAKVITDEVHLSFQNDWEIYDLPAKEIRLVNAENIKIEGELFSVGEVKKTTATGKRISVQQQSLASSWSAALSSEDIRINVTIPAKADVSLAVEGKKPQILRISIAGKKTQGSIDVGSELQLSCNSCTVTGSESGDTLHQPGRMKVQNITQEIKFSSTPYSFIISIVLADEGVFSHLAIGQSLQVSKFDFQRGALPLSAVSGSGKIAFPHLKLEAISIGQGDFLHLEPTKTLSVRRITITDAIELEMEGSVNKISSGPVGVIRSRMPNLLQYFYASEFFQLLLGAVMAIGGALASVLYRFGYLSKDT